MNSWVILGYETANLARLLGVSFLMKTFEPMAIYPPTAWQADYEWFVQETAKYPPHSASMGMEHFEAHFLQTRKDLVLANHCMERFVAAMSYLDENAKSILVDKLGVDGEDSSLVCSSVIFTLYRFFVSRPDDAINMTIPLDVFMREAIYDRENPPGKTK